MKQVHVERSSLLEKCGELAYSPSIPNVLEKEIWNRGFAGAADLPKLVFLTLYTGMSERPVSLLIKGPSGAGKSFSLRMGKQFVPNKAYEEFEGMSEKALVYLKGFNLKHKHLIIGEASGMADGEGRSLLRQLLSEGQVRYATVQNTTNGLRGETLPVLEGPCGLIMTTTATGIHHEDETRMISVNLNESPEQIAEALMVQATGSRGKVEAINTTPWFALYDYVNSGPKEVLIPFARDIARNLPRSHDRVKRDFPQVLSLISASALMHSCTRELSETGAVVANRDDYALVYNLVNDALSEGMQMTVTEPLRKLIECVRDLQPQDSLLGFEEGVSQSKLAEALKRDLSAVSRLVFKAVKEDYLVDKNPGQGRQSKLVLGDRKISTGSVLPNPKELFEVSEMRAA